MKYLEWCSINISYVKALSVIYLYESSLNTAPGIESTLSKQKVNQFVHNMFSPFCFYINYLLLNLSAHCPYSHFSNSYHK